MTTRTPVSVQRPIFYDAEQIDQTDLTTEQLANETIEASIINNHFGNGILPNTLNNNIIFNSSLFNGLLDGLPILPQNQPTDNNLGNQLTITLTNSLAAGNRQVKLCIIGLDFQSNLIYEILYFNTNESQTTRQHFAQVLLLLFNDLIGNPSISFNLGGTLIIAEASPMTLSRDVIMLAQDQQPSLFWRDFFLDPSVIQSTVQAMIQAALPLYNIANLNIQTQPLVNLSLVSGDVTTQIGEKFQTTTDNIQKITLLLSVQNLGATAPSLTWTGDLIVSIYPLQVSLDCPTDLVPNLAIEYSPSNIPYAQISYNYTTLQNSGIVLNSVPQPVDFIFSNTSIASGNIMSAGQFCAVTIKRSGAANQCDILISAGANLVNNSRVTTFSGNLWVDIPSENLWFKVWTDAAKVSDGQAYDAGNGIMIPKTIVDPTTQATIDNIVGDLQFTNGQVFSAVLAAITVASDAVPDQRTGNPVNSRQQFEPQITLLGEIDITNLEKTSSPLILGTIADMNVQFNTANTAINTPLYSATIVNNEILIKIIDDITDPRYSSLYQNLVNNLLNGNLIDAKIIPNLAIPSFNYRIASAQLDTMIVGDVDGNGIIDINDLNILNSFIGFNLNQSLPLNTQIAIDSYNLTFADGYPTLNGSPISSLDGYSSTTFTNGYETLIQPFAYATNLVWQLIDPNTNLIIADGYNGIIQPNPENFSLANFTDASVSFNIIGLSSYNLVILSNLNNSANLGGWSIVGLEATENVLNIQKVYLNGDVYAQMLRADINSDFIIDYTDGYLLNNYINRVQNVVIPTPTYPAPATNAYTNIGKTFQIIRLTVEPFVDRMDDYSINPNIRNSNIHPVPDIFANDDSLSGYIFYNTTGHPLTISINPELIWDASLVVSSSRSRLVPAVFTSETGFIENPILKGVQITEYPVLPPFDPGLVNFFVPNNLIIGNELQTLNGDFYKVDFEVGTIVLEIPDGIFGSERTIDIMGDFIATTVVNGINTGVTNLGFPAMRFADSSFVSADGLTNNQIRLSVAVQSFSPNTNGLSPDGYYGVIVDGKMGVNIDYTTGLLTLNFTNLYQDPTLQTLSTKVQVNVFLKQGGFNNLPLFVDSTQVGNMLSLISVFSGANEGGQDAQNIPYEPASSSNWNNSPPATIQEALDRIAAKIGPIL
jgi:hypothetical protein